ncbi:hypothetical protein [Tateyamaria sp.]|uniref:hypothetical protein n=1 Tax=Tateyamaria sp. TaxID=1929288 RepID=UPI00329C3EFA
MTDHQIISAIRKLRQEDPAEVPGKLAEILRGRFTAGDVDHVVAVTKAAVEPRT